MKTNLAALVPSPLLVRAVGAVRVVGAVGVIGVVGAVGLFTAPLAQAGLNTPQWTYIPAAQDAQGNAGLGSSIVPIGDFNGDDIPDVALAAGGWVPVDATSRQGAVLIWLGTGAGTAGLPNTIPNIVLASDVYTGGGFGSSVASAGDLNEDGFDDVVIGASNQNGVGAAYVVYGRSWSTTVTSKTPVRPDWKFIGTNLGPYFGWSVAGNVDVNCDGHKDILVTSHASTGPTNSCQELADVTDGNKEDNNYTGVYAGSVVAFYGAGYPTGLPQNPTAPSWAAYGRVYLSEFGWDMDAVGDFNGDGCDDFVVGSPRWGWYEANRGAIDLFLGRPDSPTISCDGPVRQVPIETNLDDYVLDFPTYGARFGQLVNRAGDINGDGLADVIVASSGFEDSSAYTDEGGFWIVYGVPALNALPSTGYSPTNQSGAYLGSSAAWAGDVNGDGFDDVIAGAPGYDSSTYNGGRVYLYLGSCQGLMSTPAAIFDGEGYWSNAGQGASGVGDLDGDGKYELMVGAPSWDTNYGVNIGKLYLMEYTWLTGEAQPPTCNKPAPEPGGK